LKWVLNLEFVTTAIHGYSTYEHLTQDFSIAGGLAYTEDEKKFLADKSFSAQAEFCQQSVLAGKRVSGRWMFPH
jgi:uncharacterized protein